MLERGWRTVAAGVAAGAAGTTALNAVTYADMALRGRPASGLPQQAVEMASERTRVPIPGEGERRTHRVEGLGSLSGIITGVGTGVIAALAAAVLPRPPLPVTATVIGGTAMAATDGPMSLLGLTHPSSWSRADWLADVVPHVAYGVVTAWTLRALRGRRVT